MNVGGNEGSLATLLPSGALLPGQGQEPRLPVWSLLALPHLCPQTLCPLPCFNHTLFTPLIRSSVFSKFPCLSRNPRITPTPLFCGPLICTGPVVYELHNTFTSKASLSHHLKHLVHLMSSGHHPVLFPIKFLPLASRYAPLLQSSLHPTFSSSCLTSQLSVIAKLLERVV